MPHKQLLMKAARAAAPASGGVARTQKPRRYRPGTVAIREIKRLQNSTEELVPCAAMKRCIREEGNDYKSDLCYTRDADDALIEMMEGYLVDLFDDSNALAIHAGRKSIQPKDMMKAYRMRGDHLLTISYNKAKDTQEMWDLINGRARRTRGERS